MFTGIVRELGRVASAEGGAEGVRLVLDAPLTAPRTGVGDSLSVNGCCLTVEKAAGASIALHAVPETLSRTTLGGLRPGDPVNLEPAVRAGEPLGGHYVQGHVDAQDMVAIDKVGGTVGGSPIGSGDIQVAAAGVGERRTERAELVVGRAILQLVR